MKTQTVYIMNVDKTKILEAAFHKIPENKLYFLTYEEALNNLLLFKLEKEIGNLLVKDSLDYNLFKIQNILNDINFLREKTFTEWQPVKGV